MSYQRAFSTLGCSEFSLGETVALADRWGVTGIELRALGGTLDLPDYFARTFNSPMNLAVGRVLGAVRIHALNTSFKLSDDAAGRTALLHVVPLAEALGVAWLRVFDGGVTGDAAELAQAAATLGWWRNLRVEKGWRCDLMVETHDSLLSGAVIARFLSLVPDVALLWDAHHTWRRGGESPAATWLAIRRNVVHVHVKDSVSQPSARHTFTYVLPGDGEFPAESLFAVLKADEFVGPVSLEWEKLWHPYLPPLSEALAAASSRGWW